MAGRIAAVWITFRERVVPATAGAVQVGETRRAFYAGAAAMFEAVTTGLDPSPEPTDNDLQRMEALEEELLQFGRDVEAGRA